MKSKIFLLIISFSLLTLTSCLEEKEAPESVEESIQELLDRNGKAYLDRDIDALMKDYAKEAILFADEKDNVYDGHAEIRKIFKEDFDNLDWKMDNYEYINLRIKHSGDVAWISTDVKSHMTYMDQKITGEGRHIMIVKKIEDKWQFVMSNFHLFPDKKTDEKSEKKVESKE